MKNKYLALLLCINFSSGAYSHSNSISIEISRNGTDMLTKSLEDALRSRISHSMDFNLNPGDRSALNIVIVESLKVKKIANHNQASYKVNFVSRQKIMGSSTGSCWEDQIHECADRILNDVKINLQRNL
jgi:hypothetical protein